MPEGIKVLAEHIQTPDVCFAAIFFLLAVTSCLITFSVFKIKDIIHNKRRTLSIILLILTIIGIACSITGIIAANNIREHEYIVTLDDDYPAKDLYENFIVRKVEGQMYTILSKD